MKEKGLQELRHECNRCKKVDPVKGSDGKVIVNELPPQGHEVDRDAATTKVEYRVSVEASTDGVVNTKLDTNGKVVLDDPTKDGKYGETVTGICTECGQEVHLDEEIKTLKATMTVEGTSKVTEVSDNIVSNIKGMDPEDANFPKNDEIVLKTAPKMLTISLLSTAATMKLLILSELMSKHTMFWKNSILMTRQKNM